MGDYNGGGRHRVVQSGLDLAGEGGDEVEGQHLEGPSGQCCGEVEAQGKVAVLSAERR